MGWCLPVSHASLEPAGFLSHPVGGVGGTPSSPSCSRSFCPWRDSLATSSAAVQLSDFVATLSPASQALPAPTPGALPGPTHIPSALVCAWLRRATCPPTVHLHSVPSRPHPFTLNVPDPALSWVFLSPLLSFGVSHQPPGVGCLRAAVAAGSAPLLPH